MVKKSGSRTGYRSFTVERVGKTWFMQKLKKRRKIR